MRAFDIFFLFVNIAYCLFHSFGAVLNEQSLQSNIININVYISWS